MKDFVLKLDLDHRRRLPRQELDRRARIVHLEIVTIKDERSPSGRGWHRTLTVRAIDGGRWRAADQVAVQLLLGSDPIREAFNLHRARLVDAKQVSSYWRSRWNVFYATSRGRELRQHFQKARSA
jgi:hypothetical protein